MALAYFAGLARTAHSSVGAALSVSGGLGDAGQAALAGDVHDAASVAFFHGFSPGNLVAAAVAGAGALMAALLLPAHPLHAASEPSRAAAPA